MTGIAFANRLLQKGANYRIEDRSLRVFESKQVIEMSQDCLETVIFSTSDRLVEAVLAHWCDRPSNALSVRSITGRAHAASSSIDYHFGGLEQLYEAAQDFALQRAEAWLSDRLTQMESLRGVDAPRGPIVAAIIDDWCEGARPLAMAAREACGFARAGRHMAAHRRWTVLFHRFWHDAADVLGMGDQGDLLILYGDGEISQHVLRWKRPLDRALLEETATTLFDALGGEMPDGSPVRTAYRQRAGREYDAAADDTEPVSALDKAAAGVLRDAGFAALTFRNVAREAGVTLGTASYHFQSKTRLVRRAFDALYRDASGSPQQLIAFSGDLPQKIVELLVEGRQVIPRVFDEIILYISRDDDFIDLRGAIRGHQDPAANWVAGHLLSSDAEITPALAAAFASICRGIDHFAIGADNAMARRSATNAFASFSRIRLRG